MNIAINTLPLSTEHRMRGTGVYTKNVIDALDRYVPGNTYTFFTKPSDIPRHADVVHYPFFDPFFLTLPFVKTRRTVVTVHDLIPLVFPERFPSGVRGNIRWHLQRASLLGASAIVTDSECSKRDILRFTGKRPDWVHVVPLAPSPQYRRITDEQEKKAVSKRYRLPEHYAMYVGDVNWNKNVTGLLDAWKIAKQRIPKQQQISLVLAGGAFTDTELHETREILRKIDALSLGKCVVRPGFIREEDMAAVYSLARFSVLPSWYEGFGFPVLEAMACGIPVVATNKGSVAEISGPAILMDPSDPKQFADALVTAAALSPSKRRELVSAGYTWASTFSWERVARETARVYDHAAGRT